MGAVVGAHSKGSQVVKLAIGGGGKGHLLWLRTSGIDCAGENLLGNIVDFHGCSHSFFRMAYYVAFMPVLLMKAK
jgi:hypothetical protein